MTIIGIDPHPGSHTAVALNDQGKRLAALTIQNDEAGLSALKNWLSSFELECCAIEGANNPFAKTLSKTILEAGHQVVDVPPSMTSQYRSKRSRKKSDQVDAENVAKAALANPELAKFAPQDKIEELKTLTRTRELFAEQLKAHRLSLAATTLETARKALETVIDVLKQELKTLEKAMEVIVDELMPELTELTGIAVVNAASLLAEIGDPRRFQSQHHFAMYAGCAPVERSSGGYQRRQLNTGGNRRLNRIFHLITQVRLRKDETSRLYRDKKLQEGKTLRATLRCLKLHVAKFVFRFMLDNARQHPERWVNA
jgi:transposase